MYSNLDENDLFEIAKAMVKEIRVGEEFIVKDLFVGYLWNRIDRDNGNPQSTIKTRAGRKFYDYFIKDQKGEFVALGKTENNQQYYKKIK
ncbi:MAG: DUF1413 domain-containing protein [Fusobacteriaceae bacterium]